MLDALHTPACVVDHLGRIVAVSAAWREFGRQNGLAAHAAGPGSSCLDACTRVSGPDAASATTFIDGLLAVLRGSAETVEFDYECSSPTQPRWFRATLTAMQVDGARHALVVHRDVTARVIAEAEVEAAQRYTRIVSSVARIGAWTYRPATDALQWSPEVADIFQAPLTDQPSLDLALSYYRPASRAVLLEHFLRCVSEGRPYELEVEAVTATGRPIWVLIAGVARFSADGAVEQVQGACMDVTHRRMAEERVRDARERLQATLENIPAAFFILDHDWRFTFANEHAAQSLARAREELIGRSIWTEFPEARGSAYERAYRQAKSEGRPVRFEAFYPPLGIWTAVTAFPAPQGLAVWFHDVTEQRRTEMALQASRQQLKTAVDAAGLGTWSWDLDAGMLHMSERAADLVALPGRHTVTSDEFLAAVDPLDRQRIIDIVAGVRTGDGYTRAEFRVPLGDGSVRWVSALGRPRQNDAGGVVIDGVNRDSTDQKNREQSLQDMNQALEARVLARTRELEEARAESDAASTAKSAFLATVSHEIRTPMNGVLGMVDVLLERPASELQRDGLCTIRDSANSLLRLIDDILDFSKIEAGRLELDNVAMVPADLVEGVCESLQPVARAAGVDLFVFVSPDVPAVLSADAGRLRQVLVNLVGNAIKFSGGEGRAGRVRVRCVCGAAGRLRIEVRDNGIGMSAETRARLFEPFTRGESAITGQYGGTGLGLAISRRLVDLMGGSIDVHSAPWQGSLFAVEVPFEAGGAAPVTATAALAGLHCVVVQAPEYQAGDLAIYLRAAGAERVEVVPDLARAAGRGLEPGHAVVVHGTTAGPATSLDATAVARLAVVQSDTYGADVPAPPHRLVIEGTLVRRERFVRAVALAAGRAAADTGGGVAALVESRAPVAAATAFDDLGHTLLIAEDDPTSQKVLLRQLQLLGLKAEVAVNGQRAYQAWSHGRHAAILTDLHMPVLDGLEFTRAVREAETPGQRIPIIAITADAASGEARKALEAGVDEVLTKPVTLSTLRRLLARWVPVGVAASVETDRPSAAAFDPTRLLTLVGGDTDAAGELLTDYRDSSAACLAQIADAAGRGDRTAVLDTAHRFKSASRSVGATAVGDLCARLESAVVADGIAVVRQLVAELAVATAAADASIQQLLESIGWSAPPRAGANLRTGRP